MVASANDPHDTLPRDLNRPYKIGPAIFVQIHPSQSKRELKRKNLNRNEVSVKQCRIDSLINATTYIYIYIYICTVFAIVLDISNATTTIPQYKYKDP